MKRKLKINLLFFLILFALSCTHDKRTPISYELPKDFSGWVTIKYEKPNAAPLKISDGHYYMKIPDTGVVETSSKMDMGMAEDEYFWNDGIKKVLLKQSSNENTTMIHSETYGGADMENFYKRDTLKIGVEYVLYDGSKVTKLDDKGGMSFKSGRFLIQHFYVSKKMESYWDFNAPTMPEIHNKW